MVFSYIFEDKDVNCNDLATYSIKGWLKKTTISGFFNEGLIILFFNSKKCF